MGTAGKKFIKKYAYTPETDAVICDAYRRFREFANRRAIPGAAAKLGWPRYILNKRARELGLARTKEKPWTDAEEQILDRYSGLSIQVISLKLRESGFRRSPTAVQLKMKRLKTRLTPNFMTATSLARAFGVDAHKVTSWMKSGFLKFQAKGTNRTEANGGDCLVAQRDDVRRFILNHPDEIDLSKVEKFWFLDVVSNGKLCEEFIREAR